MSLDIYTKVWLSFITVSVITEQKERNKMIKNEAVTKATLETKEWEGELDDAELTTVSGGLDVPIVGGVVNTVVDTASNVPVVGPVVNTVTGLLPL
ncbi:hypothetical protein SAMD00079811_24480 [Scytonema sp. HK-05]|nr:hypothetical protein SAMD00079811_24480 [Scytonema sp. HK-05]